MQFLRYNVPLLIKVVQHIIFLCCAHTWALWPQPWKLRVLLETAMMLVPTLQKRHSKLFFTLPSKSIKHSWKLIKLKKYTPIWNLSVPLRPSMMQTKSHSIEHWTKTMFKFWKSQDLVKHNYQTPCTYLFLPKHESLRKLQKLFAGCQAQKSQFIDHGVMYHFSLKQIWEQITSYHTTTW